MGFIEAQGKYARWFYRPIRQGLRHGLDLYSVTHANCACDKCANWDRSFASGWQPTIEETRTDTPEWCPRSPDEAYLRTLAATLVTPPPTPSKGSQENPIELFNIASAGLPVYELAIGPTRSDPVADAAAFVSVRTILDTGAEANYVTNNKAHAAGAQIFPIDTKEIVGARRTTTSAFASFSLKVGGILTKCYAYVLEDDTQFRYNLLLGRAWLKKHNAKPKWDEDAYELQHLEKKVPLFLKPFPTKRPPAMSKLLHKVAWRLHPKHIESHWIEPLLCTHETKARDDDSIRTINGSIETLPSVWETFSECLKCTVKKAFPSVLRDKVGFPPLQKWVHDIDVGDAKPIRKYGRPLSPPEHESIKKFVVEGLEEGVIEQSDSPWSSPLLLVPKKDSMARICVDY